MRDIRNSSFLRSHWEVELKTNSENLNFKYEKDLWFIYAVFYTVGILLVLDTINFYCMNCSEFFEEHELPVNAARLLIIVRKYILLYHKNHEENIQHWHRFVPYI